MAKNLEVTHGYDVAEMLPAQDLIGLVQTQAVHSQEWRAQRILILDVRAAHYRVVVLAAVTGSPVPRETSAHRFETLVASVADRVDPTLIIARDADRVERHPGVVRAALGDRLDNLYTVRGGRPSSSDALWTELIAPGLTHGRSRRRR